MMIVCYYRYVLHSRHTVGYFECGKCTKYWEHKRAEIQKNISVVLYPAFIHSPECIETTGLVNCPKTYFIVFYYEVLANSQNLLHVFDSKFPQCAQMWDEKHANLASIFCLHTTTRQGDVMIDARICLDPLLGE